MVKEIPEDVKAVLGQLPGPQQVTIRKYIATLRAEVKDLEAEILTLKDADPHAHFHGEERCTSDHGHGASAHHGEPESHDHHHGHKEESHHDHSHHKEPKEHDHHGHEHKHVKEEVPAASEHSHQHHSHSGEEHGKAKEEKEKCGHDHSHQHAKDDMPAWKKKALEAGNDPSAAPFGGNWTTEASLSASDDKMKE